MSDNWVPLFTDADGGMDGGVCGATGADAGAGLNSSAWGKATGGGSIPARRMAGVESLTASSGALAPGGWIDQVGWPDEDQVGAILGIGERSAVRELLPRPKPTLAELLDELI